MQLYILAYVLHYIQTKHQALNLALSYLSISACSFIGLSHLIFLDMEQRGRIGAAEAELEKLMGGSHVKSAMAEFSKTEKVDEGDNVKLSDLIYGLHFRGI